MLQTNHRAIQSLIRYHKIKAIRRKLLVVLKCIQLRRESYTWLKINSMEFRWLKRSLMRTFLEVTSEDLEVISPKTNCIMKRRNSKINWIAISILMKTSHLSSSWWIIMIRLQICSNSNGMSKNIRMLAVTKWIINQFLKKANHASQNSIRK